MRIRLALFALLLSVPAAQAQNIIVVSDCSVGISPALAVGSPNGRLVINTIGQLCGIFPVTIGAGSAIIGKVGIDQTTPGSTDHVTTSQRIATLTTSITRPSDTNAYTANDAFANSTSAPTAGGFTLTSACSASGGSGVIRDAVISASASTAYQGELWIFDQAVTATNDNAALSVSDSDILNLIGIIPFNTTDVNAANAISYVTGIDVGFTCVGTANLRFLVKIMNAPTPASAEVLSIRVKVQN